MSIRRRLSAMERGTRSPVRPVIALIELNWPEDRQCAARAAAEAEAGRTNPLLIVTLAAGSAAPDRAGALP